MTEDLYLTIHDRICRSQVRFKTDGEIEVLSEHPGMDIREFAERPTRYQLRLIAEWCGDVSGDFRVADPSGESPWRPYVAKAATREEMLKVTDACIELMARFMVQLSGGMRWDQARELAGIDGEKLKDICTKGAELLEMVKALTDGGEEE